jgi:hypothetical protein
MSFFPIMMKRAHAWWFLLAVVSIDATPFLPFLSFAVIACYLGPPTEQTERTENVASSSYQD